MYEGRKEPEYYKIRAEVLWGITLGIMILLAGWIGTKYWNREQLNKVTEGKGNQERVEVTYEGIQSKLYDGEQCYLCGNSDRSLMEYYRKFDTIGLISLNDWYVIDFHLKNYDENGNYVLENDSNNTTFGNTGEISYSSHGTVSRGMAEIDITLPEDSRLNIGILQENLCQECLDKVAASLACWKWEDEDNGALPLCLVDFETLEVYPVQNSYGAYFIRDYWVEFEFDEEKIEIEAFYLPER